MLEQGVLKVDNFQIVMIKNMITKVSSILPKNLVALFSYLWISKNDLIFL